MTAKHVQVIAEAGVNHNGDLKMALELIDVAAEAGADVVKFQTFKSDALASTTAPKAGYQLRQTGEAQSQQEMLRALELDEAAHRRLVAHCAKRGITFLSSPFDHSSLDFLVNELGLKTIKLGSGELTNGPLLLAASQAADHLILSTGMATLGEVEDALAVVAFGLMFPSRTPESLQSVRDAFAQPAAIAALHGRVSILHCTTEYPAPIEAINLRAMDTLASAFGLPVGYSDHTDGVAVSLAAVARGATMIEKHFTLNRALPGPDHAASLEPDALKALVKQIRQVSDCLGTGIKQPAPCEMGNRRVARKTLVSTEPVAPGETFSASKIAVKRHGVGVSPMHFWDVVGRTARRHYALDEPLEL